ncbi:MAG TPA: hypothetical protein VGB13_03005 [Candidatus Krumholzibacteria bacterium]|jgi:hypothetical protein
MAGGERRQAIAGLVLVALIWRVVPLIRLVRQLDAARGNLAEHAFVAPFVGSGFDLSELLLNPAIAWVGSPLYLFFAALETQLGTGGGWLLLVHSACSVVLVLGVFTEGERLLGTKPALIAGYLCAITTPIVLSTYQLLPLVVLMWGSVAIARKLSDTGRRLDSQTPFGLGVAIGVLGWVQGYASLWVVAALLWLPFMSRHFRGRDGLKTSGWLVGGWLVMMLPIVVHGAIVQRDFVLPFESAAFDVERAAATGEIFRGDGPDNLSYPLGRRARSIYLMEMQDPDATTHAVARTGHYLGGLARQWGHDPPAQLYLLLRRGTAFFGGMAPGSGLDDAPIPGMLRALPTWPADWLFVLAWLGILGLSGSTRGYLPLHAGVWIPLVVAMFTSVAAETQLVALPFLCLLAGYGVARWWEARHWAPTWLLAPASLALGLLWVRFL